MAEVIDVTDMEISWRTLLMKLLRDGERIAPRGQKTYELTDVVMVHHYPEDPLLVGVGRKLSTQLAALEALQLVGGFSDPKLTVQVAPHYENFLDGDSFHGAYGIRTQDKVGLVADRLMRDPGTRQACMQFWCDRYDLSMEGMKDYPCTMHANFRVRHGKLDMTVVMRSNDVWLGYPYDVVQFTTLLKTVAGFIGIAPGKYTHIAHSMHLYHRNLEEADAILAQGPNLTRTSPQLAGGIASPDRQWTAVQERARRITYTPYETSPATFEEEWLIDQAKKWCAPIIVP
jgi:thymidylate synthase